jgi:hypothetical protein
MTQRTLDKRININNDNNNNVIVAQKQSGRLKLKRTEMSVEKEWT